MPSRQLSKIVHFTEFADMIELRRLGQARPREVMQRMEKDAINEDASP